MFLGGGELTWKLPASPGASPEPSAHPHICPIGHQLHDCDVTRYSVPPTAPPPAPRQPHRISGERAGHFVDCYQKREVSITSFSDTCALSRSFFGPASGPVEILIGKKSWLEEIMDAIDIQRCSSRPPRRVGVGVEHVNKRQKRKPVWTPGGQWGSSFWLTHRLTSSCSRLHAFLPLCKLPGQSRPRLIFCGLENQTIIFFPP